MERTTPIVQGAIERSWRCNEGCAIGGVRSGGRAIGVEGLRLGLGGLFFAGRKSPRGKALRLPISVRHRGVEKLIASCCDQQRM